MCIKSAVPMNASGRGRSIAIETRRDPGGKNPSSTAGRPFAPRDFQKTIWELGWIFSRKGRWVMLEAVGWLLVVVGGLILLGWFMGWARRKLSGLER